MVVGLAWALPPLPPFFPFFYLFIYLLLLLLFFFLFFFQCLISPQGLAVLLQVTIKH